MPKTTPPPKEESKPPKSNRAVHRPISITVESIKDLPDVRELPQDTEITINFKMDQRRAKMMLAKIKRKLKEAGEIDFIAFTVTGISR